MNAAQQARKKNQF